jgi:hypothetical protein
MCPVSSLLSDGNDGKRRPSPKPCHVLPRPAASPARSHTCAVSPGRLCSPTAPPPAPPGADSSERGGGLASSGAAPTVKPCERASRAGRGRFGMADRLTGRHTGLSACALPVPLPAPPRVPACLAAPHRPHRPAPRPRPQRRRPGGRTGEAGGALPRASVPRRNKTHTQSSPLTSCARTRGVPPPRPLPRPAHPCARHRLALAPQHRHLPRQLSSHRPVRGPQRLEGLANLGGGGHGEEEG